MKKILLLTAFLLSLFMNAQVINFPDANFKAKLLAPISNPFEATAFNSAWNPIVIDSNNDGEIEQIEVLNIAYLLINSSSPAISNITGIEYFINLRSLSCQGNLISNLDILSTLPNLTSLDCDNNLISNLDMLGSIPNLNFLRCDNNLLTNINMSSFTALTKFLCRNNQLSSLDVSNNLTLTDL